MTAAGFVISVAFALAGQPEPDMGTISGFVINESQGGAPCGNAGVVLRCQIEGQFIPVAETIADGNGQFRFPDLPIGEDYLYLPGANRDDVHYPGPRVQLTSARPEVTVKLQVHDSVTEPSPLVLERYDIAIQPGPGVLKVTESMLVSNPTQRTYVGQAEGDEAEPTTLRLAIPADFDRTTFRQEFFGRRFSVEDDRLVTSVPWTPGERELQFTYTLRNEKTNHLWQRPLDLPCNLVRVHVDHDRPEEITCNLVAVSEANAKQLTFESQQKGLPAGYVIRVQLGDLPQPWMASARWVALSILVGLVAVASGIAVLKQRKIRASTEPALRPS